MTSRPPGRPLRQERRGPETSSREALRPARRDARREGDPAVEWLVERAERLFAAGRLDEAVPYLERTLELTREASVAVEAHLMLGGIFRQREQYPRATSHFRAAADAAPGRADVLRELGLAHAYQENNRAAAESFRRALEVEPEDAEIMRSLAVALAALGEDAEADALLRRALIVAPDDVGVLESLASHQLKMGRFSECAEALQRASTLEPDNAIVRRLGKEVNYLVEVATSSDEWRRPEPAQRLRVALDGKRGAVEQAFLERMEREGLSEAQRLNARELWRDYLSVRRARIRRVEEHAAAVHYAIGRLDFVDGCARDEVAARYEVGPRAVARVYRDIVSTLDVAVFDPRYCTQPHPVDEVDREASQQGLDREEVFRALLEDEYREYEEAHARSGSLAPMLGIDEFEDASVEYGSLLTREMMGLTLARREALRKRELERLLLVVG